MKHKRAQTEVRIRGFARMQIGERQLDGSIRLVGDSGWRKNTLTNPDAGGLTAYIAAKVGDVSGSKTPTHLQIATQTAAMNATQTSLTGETRVRKALTASTIATGTLRMTASWSSTDNAAAITIGAIGVYNTSTAGAGTLASGALFTTSQWASNQDLSATYEWRFS